MRPIDLIDAPQRRHPFPYFGRHPWERGLSIGVPRGVLRHLLKASAWNRHPEPFSKTRRGGERRDERRFVAGRKCGFSCS